MKFSFSIKLAVLIMSAIVISGCNSCGTTPSDGSNSNSTNVLKPRRADNAGPASNLNTNANTRVSKPYPGTKPGENPTLDNSKVKVINTDRGGVAPPVKKGPDNSEMFTVMKGGVVVETRRFLNNPQLQKIERITRTPGKDVVVKVYLRGGKVIDLPDNKLKNYKIDTATTILLAAGVEIKGDPSAPTKEEIMKQKKSN
ncbi:MAG: hypothetical protein HKN33_01900 [Pyrinomonadaceae bacterium]|nr:hypothetical protein [Pyrinomonadaceae bacterium]